MENLKFDTRIGILQYARTAEMGGRFVLLGGMLRGLSAINKRCRFLRLYQYLTFSARKLAVA